MPPPKIPLNLILAKLAEHAGKARGHAPKSQDLLLGPLSTDIGATPYDIVYQEDRVRLKHYRPLAPAQVKTPLLVVYALINRDTMLDLQPDRSVVQNFLKAGLDLYMLDWGYPTRRDRYLTIDDHLNGYLDQAVDDICRRRQVPAINLMGVCLGGTFAVMYAALHPEKVKNLITTVTPTNFASDKTLLHAWMKGLDIDRLLETYGNMPGGVINLGLLLLNPARLMIDKYLGFLENLDNKEFVENFIRMEKWIFDSPDVPGETFRQLVKDAYQQNLLIRNKMEVGGRRVDLRQITMPLLNIYCRHDHLVPPEASRLLTKKVGSKDTRDLCLDTGHIGIYVSAKWQKELVPLLAAWLQERDQLEGGSPDQPMSKKKTKRPRQARIAGPPPSKGQGGGNG